MALPIVVVTDFLTAPLEVESRILGDVADTVALGARSEEDLMGRIENADAVMVYHSLSLTQATIARLKRCKLIVRCGVGYDNVDWGFAAQCGIPVANVPDYGTEEVADSAIGLTLALTRGIGPLNTLLRDGGGEWNYNAMTPLRRLRSRVFGVVGLGRIGTATALRAKALGMDVVYFDPYKPDGYDKAVGIRRAETLRELLACSMVLSLHCPLTGETHHMIDSMAIEQMQEGSYLVNTARGAIVDTSVVAEAIANGRLVGAGIDVLEVEPPSADDPLIRAWRDPDHPAHHRVLINPHSAFYSEEGLKDMRIKGSEACRRALLGEGIRNVVNGVECSLTLA